MVESKLRYESETKTRSEQEKNGGAQSKQPCSGSKNLEPQVISGEPGEAQISPAIGTFHSATEKVQPSRRQATSLLQGSRFLFILIRNDLFAPLLLI
ncbi:hypothetical protein FNV43_RR19183 [Rhamnella rubrinervis]|uniref:Uncharacterized protein n=1 Tax=Rhamnella rubrinervis TaxID=2594499 RepID=A0A8K0E0C5_9ROSA|nr:hypothetical protein FNV43_RR19183 [Rhamnella rubrinervis]